MNTSANRALIGAQAVIVCAVLGIVYFLGAARSNDLQRTQLAACERGNAVRAVVFGNTSNAIEQSEGAHDPPRITQVFKGNLKTLTTPDGVSAKTGLVDCEAVIK